VSARLIDFVAAHRALFVLTGAGVSTASGIGDYRDAGGAWKRGPPVQFSEFLRSASARRRYWSRSLLGWPHFAAALPNPAHWALAQLQQAGYIAGAVTQNVDGLHRRAGQRGVIELHGSLHTVSCLACAWRCERAQLQVWLESRNASFATRSATLLADGDADFDPQELDAFEVPACPQCDGILKPDVVFFGEAVPAALVAQARAYLAPSSAMLVVGSSLMVYSGYRFARMAHAAGKPVVAINRGITRADALLEFKVDDDCGAALQALGSALDICFDG
jgi:NAD-dependent SIR2 family protein deacetylase